MGAERATKPVEAEAWERDMRLERELLAQRCDGKLAKAIGNALLGESPQDLEGMAREDRSKAEEGLVTLLWGGQLFYKHIDELTPENLLARLEAQRAQVNWLMGRLQSLQRTKGRVSACRILRAERNSKQPSVGRSRGSTSGSPQC